jgi:hypothetical protein
VVVVTEAAEEAEEEEPGDPYLKPPWWKETPEFDGMVAEYGDPFEHWVRTTPSVAEMPPKPERTPEMEAAGQVWVGLRGPDGPHWEMRGTGVVLPEGPVTQPMQGLPIVAEQEEG